MILGYARVSTEDQHLDAQIAALEDAGAERIWSEKVSGAKAQRPELKALLEHLRPGDVVTVTKYDRLIPRAIMRDSFGIPFSSRL